MPKKRYRPEDILSKLREADILISQGKTVAETIRILGISDVTYYRWRKEYGGMNTSQVKRLKASETSQGTGEGKPTASKSGIRPDS
jgi:transposase-like protein